MNEVAAHTIPTVECTSPPFWHPWGGGAENGATSGWGFYKGGIFMASTVDSSCAIYDAVLHPTRCGGVDIVGSGDLERLRHLLNAHAPQPPVRPRAGDLYWITDATPHESLPLPKRTRRQFFRLVTSEVGVWYAAHSTPNPLGVLPPDGTKVVTHDKFTGREPHELASRRARGEEVERAAEQWRKTTTRKKCVVM